MNQTKLLFPLIFISLEDDSSIVIPPQPTSPGEIMSGGEGEPVENAPIEADAPAEDETVAPQGMHVTGTQTVTHEYLTLNGKVARETIRTNNTLTAVLDFVYDDAGRPFALRYSTNGTSFQTYYYVLNLQGDVVKLIHYIPGFEYESVATYEYDAWGNIASSSGRLAEINPLRYRGYYYDNETGFYYLQSRYYDPANRRFINADATVSTGQGFIGTNAFVYASNNPVLLGDSGGDTAELVIKSKSIPYYTDNYILTVHLEIVAEAPIFDKMNVHLSNESASFSASKALHGTNALSAQIGGSVKFDALSPAGATLTCTVGGENVAVSLSGKDFSLGGKVKLDEGVYLKCSVSVAPRPHDNKRFTTQGGGGGAIAGLTAFGIGALFCAGADHPAQPGLAEVSGGMTDLVRPRLMNLFN